MRWRLLRRRLSISAPRVIVRSHVPWPFRWAILAVVFGFSAAIASWAFEFGKDIAGLERASSQELVRLRDELALLRSERERAQSIADTAESLLKAERAAQERLSQQLRQLEAENLSLKSDLGFFERLLPASNPGLNVRKLHAELEKPGRLRYQLLVMRTARASADFSGRYDVQLEGTLEGRPWSFPLPEARPLHFRQYARVEGTVDVPPEAVVTSIEARVYDQKGGLRVSQAARL